MDALIWISASLKANNSYKYHREYVSDSLAALLVTIWNEHKFELVNNAEFKDAFFIILASLVKKNHKSALTLHDDVVNGLQEGS